MVKFLIIVCGLGIILSPTTAGVAHTQAVVIDCILVHNSQCGTCEDRFNGIVTSFYEKYQSNDNINIKILDIAKIEERNSFLAEMDKLGINIGTYDDLPYVIFIWEDNYQVFDVSNLESIENKLLTILTNSDKSSPTQTVSNPLVTFLPVFNYPLLYFTVIIVAAGAFFAFLGYHIHLKRGGSHFYPRRISSNRYLVILGSSLVSVFLLTYQLLERLLGGCGCASGDIVKTLLFQKYDHIIILNFDIPIALFGILFNLGVIFQVILLAAVRVHQKSQKHMKKYHSLLISQMLLASLSLLYLVYLELFVIQVICPLCTISQIIITLNTILVCTWRPWKFNEEERFNSPFKKMNLFFNHFILKRRLFQPFSLCVIFFVLFTSITPSGNSTSQIVQLNALEIDFPITYTSERQNSLEKLDLISPYSVNSYYLLIDAILVEKPVFVLFYATWCNFCNKQKPLIMELEEEYSHKIGFIYVNGDENLQMMLDFGVTGYPTMFLIEDKTSEGYIHRVFRGLNEKSLFQSIFNNDNDIASIEAFKPLTMAQTTCTVDSDCSSDKYCAKESGDCDGTGVCESKPEVCVTVWDPVCGCDGMTYSNDCYAAMAGVNVAYTGACIPTCTTNSDCSSTEYCAKESGDCDGTGICEPKPTVCPDVWEPVCGCDRKTYGNACEAALTGMNVAYTGECDLTCSTNTDCNSDEYCAKEPGDCDGNGVCESKPEICVTVWNPVCACDGMTYSNDCYAAMAGVNVDYSGACIPTCTVNADCSSTEYCAKEPGDCEGTGICESKPEICPDVYDPVCGCDGRTYGNACEAAFTGVNVAYEGQCKVSCSTNTDCSTDEYCAKDLGNCDGNGVCEPKPAACPDVWDPVCACDGMTYSNECYAAMAGVNVDYSGPCIPTCTTNADCGTGEYCVKEPGDCEGTGICEPKPEICPDVYEPVCGCDGRTYGNACEAASAGMNIAYTGECKLTCSSNTDCNTNEYCAKEAGNCEGDGVCEPKPTVCPDVWDPICACDGMTYSNECYATMAGVNVDYTGTCTPTCTTNFDCSSTEYCAKEPGDCEGNGTCEPKPEACITLWDPVCGCDGKTYGNDCEAAAAGVNVAYTGECKLTCSTNVDCNTGEYCAKEPGNCDGFGVCEPKPAACPDLWDPVCGCDGMTYSNECYAAMVGVNVDYTGTCILTCKTNADCSSDEYCAKEPGDCDGTGICEPKPEICLTVWDPVCGCDGKTYGNACEAAAAGMNVAYTGECKPSCSTNTDCNTDEYCGKEPGDCEGTGICEPKPTGCFDVWDPVCGCDGMTYSNDCYAAMAGVNVYHTGACTPTCTTNADCSSTEYCAKEPGDCDGTGICEPKPEICPTIWDPVCGCDGKTYGNACEASSIGINVAYKGECTPTTTSFSTSTISTSTSTTSTVTLTPASGWSSLVIFLLMIILISRKRLPLNKYKVNK
ncbi:MAG: hypothetical protein JSV04_14935 [Candidatus Heimdallarchaeota archaeon]|nr:MAG: hypothetical protein JSV04_14935 [Candidatus Heimdallarchaeota archaeon]